MDVKELLGKPRDTAWEERLKKQPRRLPEPERFAFIQECLAHGADLLAMLADERGSIRGPKTLPHPDDPERVLLGNVWAEGDT